MTHFAPIQASTITLAVSALTVWTAWDRGGGYYSTQAFAAAMLLGLCVVSAGVSLFIRNVDSGAHLQAEPAEGKTGKPRWKPSAAVLLLLVLIWLCACLQTMALPGGIVRVIAPGVSSTYQDWLSAGIRNEDAQGKEVQDPAGLNMQQESIPLSVAPTYTRIALLMPAAFAGVCWLLYRCFRYWHSIILFFGLISVSGACFHFSDSSTVFDWPAMRSRNCDSFW